MRSNPSFGRTPAISFLNSITTYMRMQHKISAEFWTSTVARATENRKTRLLNKYIFYRNVVLTKVNVKRQL